MKSHYKKPSKTCARKRRNRTRIVNPTGRSPKIHWAKVKKAEKEDGAHTAG